MPRPMMRGAARGSPAFSTILQPDEIQLRRIRRNAAFARPISVRQRIADYEGTPSQLVSSTRTYEDVAGNTPKILVPVNSQRLGLIIVNTSSANVAWFSYGPPLTVGGILVGIPIQIDDYFQETNGTVSINDIWAWGPAGTVIAGIEQVMLSEGSAKQEVAALAARTAPPPSPAGSFRVVPSSFSPITPPAFVGPGGFGFGDIAANAMGGGAFGPGGGGFAPLSPYAQAAVAAWRAGGSPAIGIPSRSPSRPRHR